MSLGKGTIGGRVPVHPKLVRLPFILKTPTDLDEYGEELWQLRNAIHSA